MHPGQYEFKLEYNPIEDNYVLNISVSVNIPNIMVGYNYLIPASAMDRFRKYPLDYSHGLTNWINGFEGMACEFVGFIIKNPNPPIISSPSAFGGGDVEKISRELPGVLQYVRHPETKTKEKIWNIVQDLNDRRGWTVNEIADWLDSISGVDLEFKGETNERNND